MVGFAMLVRSRYGLLFYEPSGNAPRFLRMGAPVLRLGVLGVVDVLLPKPFNDCALIGIGHMPNQFPFRHLLEAVGGNLSRLGQTRKLKSKPRIRSAALREA